ncbi:MAG: TAXI family TRAP transporter solute-binding subunit [Acidobacteriota bacterium]|nr:TAXI family TRAP transporter solute-binding subunit [Acidobacteriota bacterium]MDH3784366.1 TAXI family TRAP transporter solute-binding subunit [Acidobacteriota bacterium]
MIRFQPTLLRSGLLLALAITLVGCAGESSDGSVTASTESSNERHFLSIGTAPPGGAFFPVGSAIAETLNDHPIDGTWDVTAEATKGTQENIRRLRSGELDLAMANSAISYFASRGSDGWDAVYDVRAVATIAPNVAMFISLAGSDVTTVADLAGRRVVVGPEGAGFEYFIRPLLAAHDLTYDDFSPLYGTQTAAVDMLSDRSAAAAFLGGAVPTASITQASSSQEIHFVPFDDEAKQSLMDAYPFFRPATIPAETYRGQTKAYEGLDVGSMHLITYASVDEDLVYRLTRSIYENRAEIAAKHPAGKAINPKNAIRDTGIDFHPGAIRFYKEIGVWPEDR